MYKKLCLVCALIAAVAMSIGLDSPASAASGIAVSVGYADSLRPNGFFPNPWQGAPNVIFVGDGNGGFDGGAIMITNNTGSAVTINDVTVTMPWNSNSWDLWGSHVVGVGQSLILTQTNGQNFDTSDYPTLNYPQTYPDGETAHATHVTLTVNGSVQPDLLDTGHVLTTGGSDFALGGGNESFQWRPIGTFGGQPGVPEPGSIVMAATALVVGCGVAWRRRGRRTSSVDTGTL